MVLALAGDSTITKFLAINLLVCSCKSISIFLSAIKLQLKRTASWRKPPAIKGNRNTYFFSEGIFSKDYSVWKNTEETPGISYFRSGEIFPETEVASLKARILPPLFAASATNMTL